MNISSGKCAPLCKLLCHVGELSKEVGVITAGLAMGEFGPAVVAGTGLIGLGADIASDISTGKSLKRIEDQVIEIATRVEALTNLAAHDRQDLTYLKDELLRHQSLEDVSPEKIATVAPHSNYTDLLVDGIEALLNHNSDSASSILKHSEELYTNLFRKIDSLPEEIQRRAAETIKTIHSEHEVTRQQIQREHEITRGKIHSEHEITRSGVQLESEKTRKDIRKDIQKEFRKFATTQRSYNFDSGPKIPSLPHTNTGELVRSITETFHKKVGTYRPQIALFSSDPNIPPQLIDVPSEMWASLKRMILRFRTHLSYLPNPISADPGDVAKRLADWKTRKQEILIRTADGKTDVYEGLIFPLFESEDIAELYFNSTSVLWGHASLGGVNGNAICETAIERFGNLNLGNINDRILRSCSMTKDLGKVLSKYNKEGDQFPDFLQETLIGFDDLNQELDSQIFRVSKSNSFSNNDYYLYARTKGDERCYCIELVNRPSLEDGTLKFAGTIRVNQLKPKAFRRRTQRWLDKNFSNSSSYQEAIKQAESIRNN